MRKIKWRVCTLLFLVSITNYARENNMNSIANVLERENRNRELEEQREERRKRQEEIDRELQYPDNNYLKQKDESDKEITSLIDNGKKFLIKEIIIEDYTDNNKEVNKLLKEYRDREIGKTDIFELISKLSEVYLVKGYTTTLFTLKGGNINKGILILKYNAGRIDRIYFKDKNENNIRNKTIISSAFPNYKNKQLNIKDIDQGIENLNTSSWNNQMVIEPSSETGYSNIIIDRNYNPSGISVGIDNSSYKDKGRYKTNFSFTQDNILGFNDTINFTYNTRLTKDMDKDSEDSYGINYSFPLGYWNIGFSYDLSNNYSSIEGETGIYTNKNKSWKNKYKISRILSRNKDSKTTFKSEIVIKNSKNYMEDKLLDVNSKVYTNSKIGIDHVNKLFGGNIFIGVDYERGLPWFGGEEDVKNVKEASKVEFDKYNINISWDKSRSFEDQSLITYKIDFGGSYSEDMLLSANAFSIGDEFTVRGFKESSASGQKGFYINNTLSYSFSGEKYQILSRFKPFIGFDFGVSRDRELENSDRLIGSAIGIKYNQGPLSTSLSYSSVIRRGRGMPKEGNPIYLNMNYRL